MAKDDCAISSTDSDAEIRTRNPKDGGKVFFLTPALFRELDLIARTRGGCIIEVESPEKTKGAPGYCHGWAIGVYKDDRVTEQHGCATEVAGFVLCNQIDLERFASHQGPEISYSEIPSGLAYHFMTWRLIGQRLDGFSMWDMLPSQDRDAAPMEVRKLASVVNAKLADRFAWNALFPGKAFASKSKLKEMDKILGLELRSLEQQYKRRLITPAPLPIGEHEYVSYNHVKYGTPWADLTTDPIPHHVQWKGLVFLRIAKDEAADNLESGFTFSAGMFDTKDEALKAAESIYKDPEVGAYGYTAEKQWVPVTKSTQ